jgi:hypothetical protein
MMKPGMGPVNTATWGGNLVWLNSSFVPAPYGSA